VLSRIKTSAAVAIDVLRIKGPVSTNVVTSTPEIRKHLSSEVKCQLGLVSILRMVLDGALPHL
jgi:hypothetical protein